VIAVPRSPKRKPHAKEAAAPVPPMKFLIMMTGEFPDVEPGLSPGSDEEKESRALLQADVIEAIEAAMKPFQGQGIRLDSLHMRVEKSEEFPL